MLKFKVNKTTIKKISFTVIKKTAKDKILKIKDKSKTERVKKTDKAQ